MKHILTSIGEIQYHVGGLDIGINVTDQVDTPNVSVWGIENHIQDN